jgi:hypothetical protein
VKWTGDSGVRFRSSRSIRSVLAPNVNPSERDLWLCAWFVAPIIGVLISRYHATIYAWLYPLILLLIAFGIERVTGIELRVTSSSHASERVSLPRYFASPLSIGAACTLGVISSLIFVRDEPGTLWVFLAHAMLILACLSAPAILFLARTGARNKWNCGLPNETLFACVLRSLALLAVFGVAHVPRSCAQQREFAQNVQSAMDWCDGVVPRLDDWKKANGVFPASLSDLGVDVVPPKLMHGAVRYSASGDSFMFDVPDPDEATFPSMFPWGWEYYSCARYWHHYN